MTIDYVLNHLLDWLQQSDPPEIALPLRNEDDYHPFHLQWDVSLFPNGMDELYQRAPVVSWSDLSRVFLKRDPAVPIFQVIRPHFGRSPCVSIR